MNSTTKPKKKFFNKLSRNVTNEVFSFISHVERPILMKVNIRFLDINLDYVKRYREYVTSRVDEFCASCDQHWYSKISLHDGSIIPAQVRCTCRYFEEFKDLSYIIPGLLFLFSAVLAYFDFYVVKILLFFNATCHILSVYLGSNYL